MSIQREADERSTEQRPFLPQVAHSTSATAAPPRPEGYNGRAFARPAKQRHLRPPRPGHQGTLGVIDRAVAGVFTSPPPPRAGNDHRGGSAMKITNEVLEAYLNCKFKGH